MQTDPTIQGLVDSFHRRMSARERFYEDAIAALAADQMMQQLKRVPQPPRRRRFLRMPCRILVRGALRFLGLVLGGQRDRPEPEPKSGSDTEPVVIEGEIIGVDPDPLCHHQASNLPRGWLLISNPNEERSISDE